MSWSDARDVQRQLSAALSTYDWNGAGVICRQLIGRLHHEATPYPEPAANAMLAALRKKRRFDLLTQVAEGLIRFGQSAPRIRRQYAQALIEQGLLLAPEHLLETLAAEPLEGDSQVAEAHGLLGRLYKQLYINANEPANQYARLFLERALAEYLQTYRSDPRKHVWHGINVVALLHRAKQDGLADRSALNASDLAHDILEVLDAASSSTDAFDLATKLEALIALGRYPEAEAAALEYSQHPDADAFEVGSTLRQLEEVWRLTDASPPGSTILPVLRAAKLHGEHGGVQATPQKLEQELAVVRNAKAHLEKIHGDDGTVTLRWYETGLVRTRSVARVERLSGKGHGTGWLVRSQDFFPSQPPRLLLLTNAHVVNAAGNDESLRPSQAQANFQGLGKVLAFENDVVWSSPPEEFDATFLAFKDAAPNAEAMPLSEEKVRFVLPEPRVYIIGHPGGRDLELSLQDNKLLDCNDRLLRYRTPTEGGSSGSPVFEADAWKVIGLHHAGGTYPRLDGGTPPYDANEGLSICAIRNATKGAP